MTASRYFFLPHLHFDVEMLPQLNYIGETSPGPEDARRGDTVELGYVPAQNIVPA